MTMSARYWNLFLLYAQVVLAYKRYLKDVAQLLGAINTDASSFSDEMFYFERRIAEIMSENSSLKTDPIASYHRMTLGDLKVSAPSVSFKEFFYFDLCIKN